MAVSIRETTDMAQLMLWRAEVLGSVFGIVPDAALMEANRDYYREHRGRGTHLAFVAEYDGRECGCGALCLSEELPSPDNPTGRCAYLMNIYVREPFRRHGVAHSIVNRLVEEAKKRGCTKIYLEATEEGRPVYASAGFREMPDMMKYYEKDTEN